MSPSNLLIVMPVIFLAGLIRGVTGFGGPLILVPVLGFFYGPISAIATSSLVDLSCNVSLFRDAWRQASLPTVGLLIFGALLTIPIGGWVMLSFEAKGIARLVYATVCAFTVLLLLGWRLKQRLSPRQFVGAGALTGVVLGATSFGAAVMPFLYSGDEPTYRNRATFILWALFCAMVGLAIVVAGGRVAADELKRAVLFIPAYLSATWIGNRFAQRVDDALLRRIVLIILLGTAVAGLLLNWK